jgi:hypothetical protein
VTGLANHPNDNVGEAIGGISAEVDHTALRQCGDFVTVVADLGKNFRRMLAESR